MVDLNKRIGILALIIKEKSGLGKTAVMKLIFLLQRVYKVPLGYDFEIYTYGPYSSEVMEDLDYAKHQKIISIDMEQYASGYQGYNLSPSRNLNQILEETREFVGPYEEPVRQVLQLFGDKSARELELLTTIVYLYGIYTINHWERDAEEISNNVHEIKPHFDLATIKKEYKQLEVQGILDQAVLTSEIA